MEHRVFECVPWPAYHAPDRLSRDVVLLHGEYPLSQ
jgi:hypothetical protein